MTRPIVGYSGRHHLNPVRGAAAVEIRNLSTAYPGSQTLALTDVSLSIPPGKLVALAGPNGSGKSTLLKSIAGLLQPQSGTILIYGNRPGACHHRVTFVPQRSDVNWNFPMRVRDFVTAGRYVHLGWFRWPSRSDHAIANSAIDSIGLTKLASRPISDLSGGQQQRMLLARAMAQEADLLLLDEPLNAVDAETSATFRNALRSWADRGGCVVMSTHDRNDLRGIFDSVLFLRKGRLESEEEGIPLARSA